MGASSLDVASSKLIEGTDLAILAAASPHFCRG
jgi:hypothetical protein